MRLNKLSIYEMNLTRIHEWIRAVDQKLNTFFALQGLFITFVTPFILKELQKKFLSVDSLLFALIFVGYSLVGYGLVKCLLSLRSNLKIKGQDITEDQLSLTYFNHIQKMSLEQYRNKMKKMNSATYEQELLGQIHISASIATRKHRYFNDALILFTLGALLLITGLSWLYLL